MEVWDDSAALGENTKMKVMLEMKKRGKQQQVVALSPIIGYMWWSKGLFGNGV